MPRTSSKKTKITPPYYPIVYVRGYAMRADEREETYYDTYYGFAATSVEKRQAAPPKYFEADMFEGQLVRFMKLGDYAYADSVNRGERISPAHPARSLWVSRFYDRDYYQDSIRTIEEHAEELCELVCETIPQRLRESDVDLGTNDEDFRVILLAHSMGGLVCRTLIQNILPKKKKQDPKRWIHRLVTMGTPHGGIELSAVPDFMERMVARTRINLFDANIFTKPRMEDYLKIPKGYDVHSLGPDGPLAFPVKRCLCLIGSDYQSYGAVRYVTGSFSDGLVKQDNAYVVSGPKPETKNGEYDDAHTAFYANVHRAHSGRRGIVNSYESFENIQRFLFGDTKIQIRLENIKVNTQIEEDCDAFYDFEFLFSIRNSNAFLHRRQQDPCENAIRFQRKKLPSSIVLHTAFLNSSLRDTDDDYSHFAMRLRVLERITKSGIFRDTEYPERQIYSESVEVRVGDGGKELPTVEYHWLSDTGDWQRAERSPDFTYRTPLRAAEAFSADIVVQASDWPDNNLTQD